MKDHVVALTDRRTQLQLKAAVQRQQLGIAMEGIESRVRSVDGLLLKARPFLHKPALLAGGAALLWFVGPGRILRLAGRAALMVSAARRLLGFVRR